MTQSVFNLSKINELPEVKMPVYFMLNKNTSVRVEYITPDEYFDMINQSIAEMIKIGAVSKKKVNQYAKDMLSGDKFPVPYITIYNKGIGQEGRHRVLAAKKINIDKIPLIIYMHHSQIVVDKYFNTYKNHTKEELNELYQKFPYNGISDLCFREITNRKEWLK